MPQPKQTQSLVKLLCDGIKIQNYDGGYYYTNPSVGEVLSAWNNLSTDKVFSDTQEDPFHIAIRKGYAFEMIDLFIRKGLQPNGVTCRGQSPLHYAAKYRSSDTIAIINALLKANGDLLEQEDIEHMTPLLMAFHANNFPAMRALINAEADINYKLSIGTTLIDCSWLHVAAYYGDKGLASTILTRDTEQLNATDREGRTPLDIAIKYGNADVAKFLFYEHKNKEAPSVTQDDYPRLLMSAFKGSSRVARTKHARTLSKVMNFFEGPKAGKSDDAIAQMKKRVQSAVAIYFQTYNTKPNRSSSFGKGCAGTKRRMKNGYDLLRLLEDHSDAQELKTAVERYCANNIKTGLFGRSLLRAAVLKALEQPATKNSCTPC